MKLNYKRTLLIGFAFLSICAFWQMYDAVIPLILKNTYGYGEDTTGVVMALDNVLALFLLPLLGAASDKVGRRMPFIVGGTVVAAVLMMILPMLDGSPMVASDLGLARTMFFVALLMLLLTMACYRSPAVALMADVTPKPLRSKANAVINLMGAVGGLYTLVAIKVAVVEGANGGRPNYTWLFAAVAALMIVAVIVLIATIRERKLVDEMRAINYGVSEEEDQGKAVEVNGREKLPPEVKRSLICILAAIALWFMGYNAVTTFFTTYADEMWSSGLSNASSCLMIATVGAVASYIPIGIISSKIGRKRMIQIGLGVAFLSFVFAAVFARKFSIALYPMFLLVGFAQAAITVNTFPMVWEISRFGNVGKYTGYYYTCSMAAQILTPMIAGQLLKNVNYNALFPYGALMVALAVIPISLAKHGDSRPDAPKNKLEAFDTDD